MYRPTKFILIGVLLTGVAWLLFTVLNTRAAMEPFRGPYDSVMHPTNSDGILSQCGEIYTFNAQENQYGVIPEGYEKDIPQHPMDIPVYGYMTETTFSVEEANALPRGENPYPKEEVLRALWDGVYIIWVAPSFADEGYEFVKEYAENWNRTHQDKIVVLSWTYNEPMPLNRPLAFSAWNASQTCQQFNDITFETFTETVRQLPSYSLTRGTPPVAELKPDGTLPSLSVEP